jgi:chemotaxis protein histidine kinase CheA
VAQALSFAALVAFSHIFESLLDAMRDKKIATTTDTVPILLRASDALADMSVQRGTTSLCPAVSPPTSPQR